MLEDVAAFRDSEIAMAFAIRSYTEAMSNRDPPKVGLQAHKVDKP
jgi:hypothetical protein